AFTSVLDEYNALIRSPEIKTAIAATLDAGHSLDLRLVQRITEQTYWRTVSPVVDIVRKYEAGSNNVYGEILARFCHDIFRETGLKSSHTFVDLGSGVGNVVLQAALEVGCESWGVEVMPNPARLARLQEKEFKARCRRWGLKPGFVKLIEDDFTRNAEMDALMKRADVLLINNKAFSTDLNQNLLYKFLDLKEGARIVSLKSFVPDNWKISEANTHDPRNLIPTRRKEYFSGSVSWTDAGGEWFVATKTDVHIRAFAEKSE
ncbi:hypothetical protein LTS18_006102, partial [Coniosporium uncinatum]